MYINSKHITAYLLLNAAIIIISQVFAVSAIKRMIYSSNEFILHLAVILILAGVGQILMGIVLHKHLFGNSLMKAIRASLRLIIGGSCITLLLIGVFIGIFYFKNQ